jgi:ABC-type oligopeptide transport system substrate-binding subunit
VSGRRRRLLAGFLLLPLGFALAGCSDPSALPVSSDEPLYFGVIRPPSGQILRFNNGAWPELLDPGLMSGQPDGRIARAIFEGLVIPDPHTLEPMEGQAYRWEVSEDLLTYTFHLRPGLVWSDGSRLTAEDFRWSWSRVLDPDVGSRYAGLLYPIAGAEDYNKRRREDPFQVGLAAPDDSTFVVTLANPTPYFLFTCTFYTLLPAHRASVEKFGDRWTRPENIVVNGPFLIAESKQGSHFSLIRNPDYWDAENVRLDEIIAYSVEELNTSVDLYKAGVIDWNPSGYIPSQFVPFMDPYTDFRSSPYQAVYFYSVNTTTPPLDDVWVRRALSFAVDRHTLVEDVLRGTRIPWGNMTPTGYPGYEHPEAIRFDPDYARECLAKAGYPGGDGFPEVDILFNTSEDHRRIAEAIQAMWMQTLGIRVTLSNQEWASYLNATTSLEYQVARRSWIGDYPDPTTFLNCFLSGDGNNRTGWSNPEYDRLLNESSREADPAKRNVMLREAERILINDGVVIPMYHYVSTELIKPYVRGHHPTSLDVHPLKFVWIDRDWREVEMPPTASRSTRERTGP